MSKSHDFYPGKKKLMTLINNTNINNFLNL